MGSSALPPISAALADVTRIGFDTAPFIYLIERHRTYAPIVREILRFVYTTPIRGYGSTVALTELLTKPVQLADSGLANRYRTFLLAARNFTLLPVSVEVVEVAAELRAHYRLRTPDALHVATAIVADCDAFLTNDRALQRVADIPILVLDDLTL